MKRLPTPPPAPPEETVVSRIFDAPRELVFHAFARAAKRHGWLGPWPGLDYPEHIVDRAVSVRFVAHAGRTTVIVRHAGATEIAWGESLERLAGELAAL